MKMTRRQLLKYSAALAAASAIGLDLVLPKELMGAEADVEKWVKGVCRYCGAGCGVLRGRQGRQGRCDQGRQGQLEQGVPLPQGQLPSSHHYRFGQGQISHAQEGRRVRQDLLERGDGPDDRQVRIAYKTGAQSVAFYGSGQAYTEESSFMNKLFKGGLGTNNIDGNPRLCMASAAVGYVSTFGKDEPMGATMILPCRLFLHRRFEHGRGPSGHLPARQ